MPTRATRLTEARFIASATQFLEMIWCRDDAYGFIGCKSRDTDRWVENPIRISHLQDDLAKVLCAYPKEGNDLYFTPNQFSKPVRRQEYGLPTSLGWCDIDEGKPEKFVPKSSIVLRTSPGRFQGLWFWNKLHSVREAEAYSKALAYKFGGDKNGWSVTKYLRLPFSYNHKKHYDRPTVDLLRIEQKVIAERPSLLSDASRGAYQNTARMPSALLRDYSTDKSVDEIISRLRHKLHSKVIYILRSKRLTEEDRSKQIFMAVAALHEAGATNDEIAACLWSNIYFISKHGRSKSKIMQEVVRIVGKLDN